MQLIYFNGDRAASQTPSSSKLTHILMYRGVSYELSKHRSSHPVRTNAEAAKLIGQPLIYRSVQYAIASASTLTDRAVRKAQRLVYRGATYVVDAA
jgi:hypothetical protein